MRRSNIDNEVRYWASMLNECGGLNEDDSNSSKDSANGGDINKATSDDKLEKEAQEFISKKGLFMALVFAYHVTHLAQEAFGRVKAKDAQKTMFSVHEDINHAMFQAAKEGKLPKSGYDAK